VFYAPQKSDVVVIGDFNNWVPQTGFQMNRTPDGNYYWKRITGLIPGTEYAYQYLIDGNLRIADPYTQKVLDPSPFGDAQIDVVTYPNLKPYPFGKTTQIVSVLQTREPQYTWQVTNFTRPDKRHLIIYEALVRDLVAAHNWQTMIDTLNYLKRMNINAIELMPFSEFENNDSWGYNPTFYFAPDKYYGTKNKLKEFIDKCHQAGIAVIMDIVFNHEFGQGPHARMYWNSTLNRPAPNNPWLNETDRHPFSVGYDFNHESAATKYYVQRALEHWISEYKIDGFRFDLSKGFTQNQTNNVGAWSTYDASRVAIWKRYADSIWARYPNTYMILEHFAETAEDKELANYGFLMWGNMNNQYNEATMGYNTNSNISGIVYNSNERQMNAPHSVGFMESHDEQRLLYKNVNFGNASGTYNTKDTTTALRRIEAAAALLFTIPGPKMYWQLGELGYDFSINACTNGTFPNNDPNNDGCRTALKPFRWEYYQEVRRKRLYDIFASLINLRRTQVPTFNSTNMAYNLVGAVKWFQLTDPNLSLTVMGNFDVVQQNLNITFQNAGTWYDYLTGATFSATGNNQSISLQPGEYHVYVNKNVTGVVTTPVLEIPVEKNGLGLYVYPNPTGSGNAMLKYMVPASGRLNLVLLNALGQPLQTLFSGTRARGEYQLPIGNVCSRLPSGTYFIRIEQNGQSYFTRFIR
jgi:1,4-alpha-glucan branching enzyme